MTKTKDIQIIDPRKVVRVYSGRPGCQCGCRGKYIESETHREMLLEANPRNDESDFNFNDRSVARVVANMNRRIAEVMTGERENHRIEGGEHHGELAVEFSINPDGVFLQDNETNRRWVAYFTA